MSVRTVLRPLRAAAFTAVCVAVTALGHGLQDGRTAGPLALGVAFAVLFPAALVAGGRERSGAAIAAGMLAGQLVLHLLFTELDTAPAAVPVMGAYAEIGAATACPDLGMLIMHLGIAALTGWWLGRGERASWRLLRRIESGTVAALRGALDRLAGIAAGPSAEGTESAALELVGCEPGGGMTSLRTRCVPRRGPPRPRCIDPVGV